MSKEEFDRKMSMLVTERKLLRLSYNKKDSEVKKEIKKRIIHIDGEIDKLKIEFNKTSVR